MKYKKIFLPTTCLVVSTLACLLGCVAERKATANLSQVLSIAVKPQFGGEACQISGTVLDSDGDPVIGAVVHLTSIPGTRLPGCATDPTGQFYLPPVTCSQNYIFNVQAGGYLSLVKTVSLPDASQLVIVVRMEDAKSLPWMIDDSSLIDMRGTAGGARIVIDPKTGEGRPEPF